MFSRLEIKNQKRTDFCLGCAITSKAEEILGEPCEESYSYAMAKKISGQPLKKWGVPPKAALLAAVEYGVLPKKYSPYSIATNERDFLADWRNWEKVKKYTVKPFQSFSRVYNLEKELQTGSVVAGLFWQGQWQGEYLLPVKNPHKFEPHEILVLEDMGNFWKILNSRGGVGIQYLSKEISFAHMYTLSPLSWSNVLSKLTAKYL